MTFGLSPTGGMSAHFRQLVFAMWLSARTGHSLLVPSPFNDTPAGFDVDVDQGSAVASCSTPPAGRPHTLSRPPRPCTCGRVRRHPHRLGARSAPDAASARSLLERVRPFCEVTAAAVVRARWLRDGSCDHALASRRCDAMQRELGGLKSADGRKCSLAQTFLVERDGADGDGTTPSPDLARLTAAANAVSYAGPLAAMVRTAVIALATDKGCASVLSAAGSHMTRTALDVAPVVRSSFCGPRA